jgi:hypothetical protein
MILGMFEWGDLATVGVLIVLEGLLSADNAMVMAVMVLGFRPSITRRFRRMTARCLSRHHDAHRVLAHPSRSQKSSAVYLLYCRTSISGIGSRPRTSRAAKVEPWLGFGLLGDSGQVELMNLFSRSIRSGGGRDVSQDQVVLAGGILGIVAMRIVVGRLLALIQKYPAIVDGAFIIIAWVGSKLLVEYLHAEGFIPLEIPQWFSLTVIVAIFVVSLFYARREAALHRVQRLEGLTAEDAANVFVDTDV